MTADQYTNLLSAIGVAASGATALALRLSSRASKTIRRQRVEIEDGLEIIHQTREAAIARGARKRDLPRTRAEKRAALEGDSDDDSEG